MRRTWRVVVGCSALIALGTGVFVLNRADRSIFSLDDALVARLRASAEPRDWALAADAIGQIDAFGGNAVSLDDRAALLAKAAAAAPDDALVQWLAHADARPTTADTARRLAASDPGNAATWLASLAVASAANDAAGIDAALAGMAAAQRYDEHFRDYLLAWVDVYRRVSKRADELDAYTDAMARAAAFANPPYKPLVDACDLSKHEPMPASRADACESAGRLMTAGSTFIVQMVGHAVLRRSGQATPADAEAERTLRWLLHQARPRDDEDMLDYMRQTIVDWAEAGTEVEVVRRRLARNGTPSSPPPDWHWRAEKR